MKERETPLNYQITVNNVTRIGSKSMSVFLLLPRTTMFSSLVRAQSTSGSLPSYMARSIRKIHAFLGLSPRTHINSLLLSINWMEELTAWSAACPFSSCVVKVRKSFSSLAVPRTIEGVKLLRLISSIRNARQQW